MSRPRPRATRAHRLLYLGLSCSLARTAPAAVNQSLVVRVALDTAASLCITRPLALVKAQAVALLLNDSTRAKRVCVHDGGKQCRKSVEEHRAFAPFRLLFRGRFVEPEHVNAQRKDLVSRQDAIPIGVEARKNLAQHVQSAWRELRVLRRDCCGIKMRGAWQRYI